MCGADPDVERPARPWLLVVAAVAWVASTFLHGVGTDLARAYFTWAQTPGHLTDEGGLSGMQRGELLAMVVAVALGLGLAVWAVRRVRLPDRAAVGDVVVRWLVWAVAALLTWSVLIVYASELVHFGQYALVAALLAAGLPGRRPQLAFLLAVGLGALDEAWQHWGLAYWVQGNPRHGFDWSDLVLDAIGASAGALPFVRIGDGRSGDRRVLWTVGVLSALLLPLLLLSPRTLASLFGTYTYHPFWSELENGKPVHWLTPFDGIPLFLAALLFLGLLLSTRRRFLGAPAVLALGVLVWIGIDPPRRLEGRPVHEVVPTARAARVTAGEVRIDGRLDEAVWSSAERLGPFRDSPSGRAGRPVEGGERPLAPTYARVAWDDDALYVAFEVEDTDVWARDVPRDEPTLPGDEVVEVFLDPDGDELTYYEFEWSPLGVAYDLFNLIPEAPTDYVPSAHFLGLADWDARGVQAAVAVDGTLDVVAEWEPAAPLDEDRGWTVEVAIPWSAFRTTTTPRSVTRVSLPPRPGDRWRLGLYRVERPRVSPDDGSPLDREASKPHTELQAWSPTHHPGFHRPERFGVLEFDE